MSDTNRARLKALVAAYGADPARWPVAERAAARTVAERPETAQVLAQARRLDAALAAAPTPAPAGEALLARLLAVPDRPRQVPFLSSLAEDVRALLAPRALAGELTALAAALLAGLWLGASSSTVEADSLDLTAYLLGGDMEMLEEEERQ